MKKFLLTLIIFSLSLSFATKSFAQDGIYGAVKVDKTKLEAPPENLPGEIPELVEEKELPNIDTSKIKPNNVYSESGLNNKQNVKLQDALLKIDSAQVDIKNELNLYESKLLDVKNRETLIKQEKKELEKQIRYVKKKMKSLDSAKRKIISNMNLDKEGAPVPQKKGLFNFFN